jgi:hypothetical protein
MKRERNEGLRDGEERSGKSQNHGEEMMPGIAAANRAPP